MKKRWMFLLLVVAGGLLLAGQSPTRIAVMPLPASTARVRLELPVRFPGDYRVEVSMPKVDDKLTLSEETFPSTSCVQKRMGRGCFATHHEHAYCK